MNDSSYNPDEWKQVMIDIPKDVEYEGKKVTDTKLWIGAHEKGWRMLNVKVGTKRFRYFYELPCGTHLFAKSSDAKDYATMYYDKARVQTCLADEFGASNDTESFPQDLEDYFAGTLDASEASHPGNCFADEFGTNEDNGETSVVESEDVTKWQRRTSIPYKRDTINEICVGLLRHGWKVERLCNCDDCTLRLTEPITRNVYIYNFVRNCWKVQTYFQRCKKRRRVRITDPENLVYDSFITALPVIVKTLNVSTQDKQNAYCEKCVVKEELPEKKNPSEKKEPPEIKKAPRKRQMPADPYFVERFLGIGAPKEGWKIYFQGTDSTDQTVYDYYDPSQKKYTDLRDARSAREKSLKEVGKTLEYKDEDRPNKAFTREKICKCLCKTRNWSLALLGTKSNMRVGAAALKLFQMGWSVHKFSEPNKTHVRVKNLSVVTPKGGMYKSVKAAIPGMMQDLLTCL